jgi:hypothetical protein
MIMSKIQDFEKDIAHYLDMDQRMDGPSPNVLRSSKIED